MSEANNGRTLRSRDILLYYLEYEWWKPFGPNQEEKFTYCGRQAFDKATKSLVVGLNMSRILNYIKRHPMRIAASVAITIRYGNFSTILRHGSFRGTECDSRCFPNIVLGYQGAAWTGEFNKYTVRARRHHEGKGRSLFTKKWRHSADTKIKSIDVKRIGAGEGVISMVFLCSIVYSG